MASPIIEYYIKALSEDWKTLENLHEELLMFADDEDEVQAELNQFEEVRGKYSDIIVLLQKKKAIDDTSPSEADIRLPRLSIPPFEGKYDSWKAFHDIFVRLIHNNKRLANVEKMQYLKTHLKGEAGRLLSHLEISDANYTIAWEIITDRYDNKRKLISAHLQTLLALPKVEVESCNALKKIHDTTKECLHGINNLGVNTSSWAPMIIHIMLQKIDYETLRLYEQSVSKPKEIPSFEDFYNFLEIRFQTLETIEGKKREACRQRPQEKPKFPAVRNYLTTTEQKCRYCQKNHTIYNCSEFIALNPKNRNEAIIRKNLCTNCLNHDNKDRCRSRYRCTICQKLHHTLLHQNPSTNVDKAKEGPKIQTVLAEQSNEVLLATALIKATALNGKTELLRALIDTGSQASFITENAVQTLSLLKIKTYAKVSGLGATNAATASGKIRLQISPRFSSSYQTSIEALVLPKLTRHLPNTSNIIPIPWKNCLLADPTFDRSGPIDVIIGADVYSDIALNGIKKSHDGLLAQNTELGWIISGRIPVIHKPLKIVSMISQSELDDQLKRFWEIEEVATTEENIREDDICEQHYMKTHYRNKDGTYSVRIPFKNPRKALGESRKRALARLLQNEKKFATDKNLEQEYKKFMAEYLNLGHMVPVTNGEPTTNTFYLPHHAVLKHDSTTTKLRVVFDASSKTTTGISLNDNMLAGPRIQQDLSQILLRWRKHRHVFKADIEKMYRQIKMAPEDQDYQRILWRFNPKGPIKEYKLTTVTYGTTSAPFLAVRTILQLAKDEGEKYPRASEVLLEDCYVDDVISGADTIKEAQQLQKDVLELMKAGGFTLRKWASNSPSILSAIPNDMKEEKGNLSLAEDDTIKTLGIFWNPTTDTFHFKVNLQLVDKQLTKRVILSKAAQIFDPLGWLTPVTLRAKLMIQELWKTGLAWDEAIPSNLMTEWIKYQNELPQLEKIKIKRWISYSQNEKIEIHGFSDASERAYSAAIYSKITTATGNSIIQLLTAKSKVAPLKSKLTIPRLELCGAELLARLMVQTVKTLKLTNTSIFLWCDSMITIARIKGTQKKLEQFEANRIAKIRASIDPSHWNYIRTNDNPADCASRGVDPAQLKDHKLWWTGPTWLSLPQNLWPQTPHEPVEIPKEVPNEKINLLLQTNITDSQFINRFSSLRRCIRVLSYCRRFVTQCQKRTQYTDRDLSSTEIERTLTSIVKHVQFMTFSEEIQRLQQGKPLSPKSIILSLTPFLDKQGLLRVGGRLEHSFLSYDERHPVILPQKAHFTSLVIQDAHHKTLHGGIQITIAYLRRKYWIPTVRNAVRKYIHSCIRCFRFKASVNQQLMGDLPERRVIPSSPFTHTGVDYAGPIHLKMSKGRGIKTYKGYIALFVCCATKAVHIEAVSDQTSDAFLAAFRRFTARRGMCRHLYSDCGTNFVGAQRILDEQLQLAIERSTKEVAKIISSDGVEWHFNPPAAPHLGGLWEAGIKSIKYHLRRIIGDVLLTFEELTTTLTQIEACLNSRPLCPISNDPTDINVLTPGHFLIGRAPLSPPTAEETDKASNYSTRWKLVNKLNEDFWKIWSTEYLSRLQQRPKWRQTQENLNPGELVLIKDDNMPPTKWRIARITETHPGKDGNTRVVTLRCGNNSILKRPISKLCKLPIDQPLQNPSVDDNTNLTTNLSTIRCQVNREDYQIDSARPAKRKYIEKLMSNCSMKCYIKEVESLRKRRKPNKIRIRPVTGYSSLIPIEEQQAARERYERMISSQKRQSAMNEEPKSKARRYDTSFTNWNITFLCLILLVAAKVGKCSYNITYPKPGLYIEHIGEANLRRGSLRVELTLPLNTTVDALRVNNTIAQMGKVCKACENISSNIHCNQLMHHLQVQGEYLIQEIDALNINHPRIKRGLLGQALQYVFGVNDEVYTDIATIQQNQQSLQQASIHQSAIMLSTIAHMNDTESRITQKINSVTEKLNKALTELSTAQGWFTKIDTNQINIHILTAYQMASNALEEMERHYTRLTAATFGRGSITDFLTPSKLTNILEKARAKLPSNLNIINTPEKRIEISRNESSITLLGYFDIVETDQYSVSKVTPIPKQLKNNTFTLPDIPNTILAVNYNTQTYFEINEKDFKDSVTGDKQLILRTPTVVSSIESNPNCVIDELYQRHERHPCAIRTFTVPNVVWKHLYMKNTWLFITTAPLAVAIKCNGIRQDVTLNGTGIIQISQECIIQTKKNTLKSEFVDKILVKSSFSKPMELNLNTTISIGHPEPHQLEFEPVLKSSDHLLQVVNTETFKHMMTSTPLRTIGYHVTSSVIAVIITILLLLGIFKFRKNRQQAKSSSIPLNFLLRSTISTPTTTHSTQESSSQHLEGENV